MSANARPPMPPAPIPCTARNTISWTIDCTAPDSADPARNTTTDSR
ncbi:hypothetical protein QP089_47795 [Actinomadura sp. OS1-43]|nr:hypothetical protein [Actinomadura sp. OS1-43]MDL4822011.1 hypothetical protein [Actinomadura sp. OS1-43]